MELGYGVNDIPRTNLTWILLNWKLKIFSRPVSNTKIQIKTWPRDTDHLYSYRDFEITDTAGKLIAIATSRWVLLDVALHRLTSITDEIIRIYQPISEKVFDEPFCCKLSEPETSDSSSAFVIQRRDIDTNNHVNNLCYLDYAFETLPKEIYENCLDQFNNVQIMYKKETALGEEIVCLYKKTQTGHVVVIKSKDLKNLHSIISLSE